MSDTKKKTTMTNEERRERVRVLGQELCELRATCPHDIVRDECRMEDDGYCTICGMQFFNYYLDGGD